MINNDSTMKQNNNLQRPLIFEDVTHNVKPSQRIEIDNSKISLDDITHLIAMITSNDAHHYIHPVPYADIKDAGKENIAMVLHQLGLYTFPTKEVTDWFKNEVDDDPDLYPDAIEICAGTGWIGRTLGIPITDSKMQEREDIRRLYLLQGQPPITYPDDIEQLDAIAAIKKYQPEYVIGSYVTHKWDRHSRKVGNMYGVDTVWVVNHCHKYFHIGNLHTHQYDPIMQRPHKAYSFPWLITRGNSDLARIFVWEQKQWR